MRRTKLTRPRLARPRPRPCRDDHRAMARESCLPQIRVQVRVLQPIVRSAVNLLIRLMLVRMRMRMVRHMMTWSSSAPNCHRIMIHSTPRLLHKSMRVNGCRMRRLRFRLRCDPVLVIRSSFHRAIPPHPQSPSRHLVYSVTHSRQRAHSVIG